MTTNKALDAADDFLGAGYKEVAPGVFRSKDGLRQVRMTDADITGAHGGGAHMNFETGKSITNPNGRVTFKVTDNMHIYDDRSYEYIRKKSDIQDMSLLKLIKQTTIMALLRMKY